MMNGESTYYEAFRHNRTTIPHVLLICSCLEVEGTQAAV